jgi:hypothetical protein
MLIRRHYIFWITKDNERFIKSAFILALIKSEWKKMHV